MEQNTHGMVSEAKRCYTILGIALFAIAVITVLVQVVLALTARLWASMGLVFVSSSWFSWLPNFVPLSLV